MTATLPAVPHDALERAVGAEQWWFVRIYTSGFDGSDLLVGDLLPPLVAEARAHGIRRWFFIRYVDPDGPHVRLRVRAGRDVLDHLHRVHGELAADLAGWVTSRPTEHRFVVPLDRRAWEGRSAQGIRAAVYEPEAQKYGGRRGLDLAEELFEFSSDLALWACGRFETKDGARAALATLLLADGARALLQGGQADTPPRQRVGWDAYWDRHLAWWTGAVRGRPTEAQTLVVDLAQRRREPVLESLEATSRLPGVAVWRRRWRRAVDAYLAKAAEAEVDRSPQHLTFHQNHMMLNRLGFLPREEAVLGVHARNWAESG